MMRSLKQQKGNVLFLILIAVALFAALSYAVTQSSRSGSDANRETNVINTSQLTQYPNQVRTAVLRLVIGGLDPALLQFNNLDEQTGVTPYDKFSPTKAVFHPQGGSAAHTKIPVKILVSATTDQEWIYTMAFRIPGLGSDNTDGSGNELIAFADDLTQTICSRLNADLGWGTTIPVTNAALTLATSRTPAYRIATDSLLTAPSTDGVVPNDGASPNWFKGKAFGCFQNDTAGKYVFYYTLVER
jgi:ABC-type amino acid transport substrate-binding protein